MHLVSLLKGTTPHTLAPSPQPSGLPPDLPWVHSRGPDRPSQLPHFGKVILRGAGDFHRDQMVDRGGPRKVGKGRLQSRSPLDNFGMATGGVRGEVWARLLALRTGELSGYFPDFSLWLTPSQCLAHL